MPECSRTGPQSSRFAARNTPTLCGNLSSGSTASYHTLAPWLAHGERGETSKGGRFTTYEGTPVS